MPRINRTALPKAGFFHVICRANNRSVVFKDDDDFKAFLGRLQRFKEQWPFHLYHFSLMSTHAHFVIEADDIFYLSKAFQSIQVSYSSYFNKKYNCVGHVWHAPFRSIPIETEQYLLCCGRYVELNPVRGGIVEYPEDYKWSSYQHYESGIASPLIETTPLYTAFGENSRERQLSYKIFIYEAMEQELLQNDTVVLAPKWLSIKISRMAKRER